MHQSLVKFSESEASNHTPSLADFTTTTPELKFSVHTRVRPLLTRPLVRAPPALPTLAVNPLAMRAPPSGACTRFVVIGSMQRSFARHCVLRTEKRFPLRPRVPIFPPRRAKGNVWPDRSLRAGETSLLTCGTAQGLSLSPPRRCVFRDSLALQLPFFEMSALRGGLMDSAPE